MCKNSVTFSFYLFIRMKRFSNISHNIDIIIIILFQSDYLYTVIYSSGKICDLSKYVESPSIIMYHKVH